MCTPGYSVKRDKKALAAAGTSIAVVQVCSVVLYTVCWETDPGVTYIIIAIH